MKVKKEDLKNPDDPDVEMLKYLFGFVLDDQELQESLEDQTSDEGFLDLLNQTSDGQQPEGQEEPEGQQPEYRHPQSPGPFSVPPEPNVIQIEEPDNTVPMMTHYGVPLYGPGTAPWPTFGEQSNFNMVEPVLPPIQDPPLSQTEEREKTEGSAKPYIKKPPNAFMLFLKANRASAQEALGVTTSSVVNKHLGSIMLKYLFGFVLDDQELQESLEDQTSDEGFLDLLNQTSDGQQPEGQEEPEGQQPEYRHPQSPGPFSVPPEPNVIQIEEPDNTVPMMTHYGVPLYGPGTAPWPTFGEQSNFNMVEPVLPPIQDPPLSQTEEREKTEGSAKPYIKKPPNAFMLFLKANRASAQEALGVTTSSVVNKHLGSIMLKYLFGFVLDDQELQESLEDQTSDEGFLDLLNQTSDGQQPEGQEEPEGQQPEYRHPQSPGPFSVPPEPNVIQIEEPDNTVPMMTHYGVPLYGPGTAPWPTFGEQSNFNMVEPVLPPIQDPPLSQTEEREKTEGSAKPYIKKPPNAFMLFLKANRASAQEALGVTTSSVVNKHLGSIWKSLPQEIRSGYENEAKTFSIVHSATHPEWSNKINYRKKRKRIWTKRSGRKEETPSRTS